MVEVGLQLGDARFVAAAHRVEDEEERVALNDLLGFAEADQAGVTYEYDVPVVTEKEKKSLIFSGYIGISKQFSLFADGDDDDLLSEEVDVLGPLLDLVVRPLSLRPRIVLGGLFRLALQSREEVRVEDVHVLPFALGELLLEEILEVEVYDRVVDVLLVLEGFVVGAVDSLLLVVH